MRGGVALLAEHDGFLGLNEYDWQNWDSSRSWGYKWRLGHWELNAKFILMHAGIVPTIGIGEGVLDGKIWTSRLPQDDPLHKKPYGYQKIKDGWEYLHDIQSIEVDSYHRPEVAFHLLFAWAPGHPHWDSYDVSVMQGALSEYLRQSPPIYWEGGGSMGIWGNVPPQISQWKELIGKCTREHHVPIPDYEGIPVSPAKTVACIMMKESSGDPGATNPETGAAGLMQIMPMHFEEGQDPYEPEWNVKKGLSIFEDKITKSNDLFTALFWYSGKADRPVGPFTWDYWEPFVAWYKEFWGVDLEPGEEVDWEKKYTNLRNGVVAAINTLEAVLKDG